MSLCNLPELRYLDFTGNNFSGDIPASFGKFQKLEVILLVDNLIGATFRLSSPRRWRS
ncbi:putative non-specific serine/threonine protein kinase [Helianthus annuus]|nr:putative non-specific serine/threonine protein kinase [Helianthus annuus]